MIRLTLSPADELERQLIDAKVTGFLREQQLIPGRRFRCDFSWEEIRIVVEVDGGTWSRQGGKRCRLCGEVPKGRHGTGAGRETDCEKQNLAAINGWRYLIVTTRQVRDGQALIWIQQAIALGSTQLKSGAKLISPCQVKREAQWK